MQGTRGVSVPVMAAGLIGAGGVYFASRVGALQHGAGSTALAGLAGLALLVVALRVDPAWLISAGILSTMFASHWDLLGLSTSVGPDRIVLAVAALALLLRLGPSRTRPDVPITTVHVLLGATLAYAVISGLVVGTLTSHYGQFDLIDQYGALPFFMFLIAPLAFRTVRQRRILIGSLVAAGLYLGLTAILEKLHVSALVIPHYITDPTVGIHYGRARGPFVDAGADGMALFSCVVAGSVALVDIRHSRWRWTAAAVIVLGLVGVLLTETRGDWLAAGLGSVVALGTTPALRRWLVPGAVGAALLVIVAFGVIPGLGTQVQSRLNDQSSVYERDNTNAAGLRMLAARPLLGFGWQRGNEELPSYFRVSPDIPLTGADAGFSDLFLQYAVGLGVLGVALWLLATGTAFTAALLGPIPESMRLWPAGLKALVVAWVVMGFTAPTDYIFSTLVMWTWAGALYGPRLLSSGRPQLGADSETT